MPLSALDHEDLRLLACPRCRGALAAAGPRDGSALACDACGMRWPVRGRLPRLLDEALVRGPDRFMRAVFYDRLAPLHDPVVRLMMPLIQGIPEDEMRSFYLRRLGLDTLGRPRGRRPRILEVGIGSGANVARVRDSLPADVEADLWGCDLSSGMLAALTSRLDRRGVPLPRLVQADAHALPFADATFDRVFHVGGIGAYRDPRAALAEMARVAIPGTPILVVDEQIDPDARLNLIQRGLFRAFTFYDRRPHAPLEHLPAGALAVQQEQCGPAFYCLTFRMPTGGGT